MGINGVHTLIYTPEADAARRVLRDVFGWEHVDAGDGWLIFTTPPGEMAVHPSEGTAHEIAFMCDDLASTVADLEGKGIAFSGHTEDQGWGITRTMVLPGGVEMMLYEPRHPTAI